MGSYESTGAIYDPYFQFEEKNHDPHYYAIYDDKQRIMVLACHNNHFGDGWEHEGDNDSYFYTFSMPLAYPMFINIITYAMELYRKPATGSIGFAWIAFSSFGLGFLALAQEPLEREPRGEA